MARTVQRGFAYLWLLFFVALMGVSISGAGAVWDIVARREKELELLRTGDEIRRAITSYYQETPQAAKELPPNLDALLLDRRFPGLKRHLRRLYADPMTGKAQWGLVTTPDGRLRGVYSLAPGTPIRSGNFRKADEAFANAKTYAQWRFLGPAGVPAQLPAGTQAVPRPPGAPTPASPVPSGTGPQDGAPVGGGAATVPGPVSPIGGSPAQLQPAGPGPEDVLGRN